jgi:hypothetical protein
MFDNNPLLKQVGSTEGAKHRVKRLVADGLKELAHLQHDPLFVRNRLRATGVNTVGADKNILQFWYDQVDTQMEVTHNFTKPKVAPPPKKGLAKRLGKSVGYATHMLL